MEQFTRIKSLLISNMSVSYKNLYIGPILIDGEKYIQVHIDRFDLFFSKIYSIENINLAISKFTRLLTRYIASEIKNGT